MAHLQSIHHATRLGRLWVQEAGAGPVLVFLHGILSESTSWHGLLPALVDRHRVILVDGPGHGQSDEPPPGVTLEDYADAIAEVLGARGVDEAVFVGLSLGGMVAQRFALRHPDRVRGLVLLGTTADGPSWLVRLRFALTGALIGHVGMITPIRKSLGRWVFAPGFLDARPQLAAQLRERYAAWDARKTRRIFEGLFQVQGVRDQLPRVQAPALVMVGSLDAVAPPAFSRALAAALPNARLRVLDGVGHVIPLEAPEILLEELAAFLGAPEATAGSRPGSGGARNT